MEASANTRASRWSDTPSQAASVGIHQEGNSAEKRPPPAAAAAAAPEAPFKKSRLDLGQAPAGELASNFGRDPSSGYTELPGGSIQSNQGIQGYGSSFADQGYDPSFGSNTVDRSFGSFAPGSAKGSGTAALFYKTKLCTKFKLGACTFNERCHFAHGMEDLRKPPPGWEEVMKQGPGSGGQIVEPPRRSNKPCRYYVDGNCPYGERCTFSHGNEDTQRGTVPSTDPLPGSGTANTSGRSNYKTRLCTRWEKGEPCMYGDKCHFAHGQAELRTYSGGSNYNSAPIPAPAMYSDSNVVNAPPLAPSYGAPLSYGGPGAPPPVSASLNTYAVAGTNMSSYGSQQDGSNGYSTNYSYWNPENKWDGANNGMNAPTSSMPVQGYGQANQTAPWTASYSVDGVYAKNDNPQAPYYSQVPTQQQPVAPYYGSAPSYHDLNQSVNPASYAPSGTPSNGNGAAYYSSNYPNQPVSYSGSYHAPQ